MSFKKIFGFHIPIWLVIIIAILIILLIILVILNSCKKPEPQPLEQAPSQKVLPAEVHSYVGEITKIFNDYLLMQASAKKNYLLQDVLLTVKIDEQTEFTALNIPKKLTGDPEKDVILKVEIVKSDLKVGQTVVVSCTENIKNMSTFTADKIEIQMVK